MAGAGEDEFADRDHQGLQPVKKDGPNDAQAAVAAAQSRYMKLYFLIIPCIQQALAWAVYCALIFGVPGQKKVLDAKFEFLHAWDLGYVFLAVWIVSLARNRVSVNANAARAGARVDRPDQHIYKVMDRNCSQNAPFVLMANTGPAGRFNRAQRGVFNTDEAMPLFLANLLLAGAVFGPAILPLAILAGFGRVKFALGYTEGNKNRSGGFLPALVGEQWTAGLVLLCAIKAIAGSRIPF